jgi:hypothetical protein
VSYDASISQETLDTKNCSRVLVSQGCHQIYITIAQYTSQYLDYLQGGSATREAILRMFLFGPYHINFPEEMRAFGSQITELLTYATKSTVETFERTLREQSPESSSDASQSPQGVGTIDDVEELEQSLSKLIGDGTM